MPVHDANWRDSLTRLGKAVQVPDLRRRILFVAGMLSLFVLGLHVPSPFVNPQAIEKLASTGVFGFIDMLSGGAFKRLSILALGIVPYINASIIMQLLGIAIPSIQRLQKEGDTGRKTISMYTRWGTVALALLQGTGLGFYLYKAGAVTGAIWHIIPLVIVMAAGTSFLMWVGEQLTDKGIGNGVSLIIFAGILIRLPSTLGSLVNLIWVKYEDMPAYAILSLAAVLFIFVAMIVFVTWVNQAVRKIPIQHAKRVVGGRAFSASNTYLPLKVVTAGVIPIIFAISLVMLPGTVAAMLQGQDKYVKLVEVLNWFSPGQHWIGGVLYFLLVVFFTYFYTAVVYNVGDIADNLKKQGSFIPGLRPGKQTEKYIDQVLTRITFAGAMFLGIIALMPYIIPVILNDRGGATTSLFSLMGGTSILIVVGVALDTMKQIEAALVMRHYDGFIK